MSKTNLAKFIKNAKRTLSKHSPEILTGIGIAGMVTTTVLAVKATPKALKLIEEKKKINHVETLTVVDTIKIAWKPYIPTVVTGTVSIACLIGSNSVSARRHAALATAYALSETALNEYKEKVIETIGEKKEQAVMDAIAKDKVEKNSIDNREVIITEKGQTLCLEVLSGRYFKSDIDKIKKAENEFNRRLLQETYMDLNEFYYELGLPETELGSTIGWNVNDGLMETYASAQLTPEGEPCIVVNYRTGPRYDYEHR